MSKPSLPEILVRAAGGLVCSTLTGTVIWLLDANPHVIVIWSLIALAIGIIVSTQLVYRKPL